MPRFKILLPIVLVVLASGCSSPETPPAVSAAPENFATSRQVMLGLTIPAADVVWGVGSAEPADDLAWEKVAANAAMLAESGQLLLSGSRNLQQPVWTTQSQALIEAGKAAAVAAQKHDVDGVLAAGDAMYNACDACHNDFLPAKVAERAQSATAP